MASTVKSNETVLRIAGQSQGAGAVPREEMGVVSPCSTCQNYTNSLSTSDANRTPCPRRSWITANTQGMLNIDPVLYLSGTSDPNTLTNPVIDPSTNNYLVWVAAVDDNPGIVGSDGSTVTTSILSQDFNNLYIKCRSNPYIPEDNHTILKLKGHLLEMDEVWATENRHSSIDPINPGLTVPVAGTVVKGTFASSFSSQSPADHLLTPG